MINHPESYVQNSAHCCKMPSNTHAITPICINAAPPSAMLAQLWKKLCVNVFHGMAGIIFRQTRDDHSVLGFNVGPPYPQYCRLNNFCVFKFSRLSDLGTFREVYSRIFIFLHYNIELYKIIIIILAKFLNSRICPSRENLNLAIIARSTLWPMSEGNSSHLFCFSTEPNTAILQDGRPKTLWARFNQGFGRTNGCQLVASSTKRQHVFVRKLVRVRHDNLRTVGWIAFKFQMVVL